MKTGIKRLNKAEKEQKALETTFEKLWKNPPDAFNPVYKPHAKQIHAETTKSMERDDFYSGHNREECKVEWQKRYHTRMIEYEIGLGLL